MTDASGIPSREAGSALDPVAMARMRAQRNVLYHAIREAHFDRIMKFANMTLIILAVLLSWASMTGDAAGRIPWLGAAVVLVVGLSVMLDPTGTREFHALQRLRFALLDEDLAQGKDPRAVEAEFAILYGSEPSTMHAVNALAYNAVQMSHGRSPSTLLPIGRFERLAANWLAFDPDRFTPRG